MRIDSSKLRELRGFDFQALGRIDPRGSARLPCFAGSRRVDCFHLEHCGASCAFFSARRRNPISNLDPSRMTRPTCSYGGVRPSHSVDRCCARHSLVLAPCDDPMPPPGGFIMPDVGRSRSDSGLSSTPAGRSPRSLCTSRILSGGDREAVLMPSQCLDHVVAVERRARSQHPRPLAPAAFAVTSTPATSLAAPFAKFVSPSGAGPRKSTALSPVSTRPRRAFRPFALVSPPPAPCVQP